MNKSDRCQCPNHPNNFCYVCGKFTPKPQWKKIYKTTKIAYFHYFGCKIGDEDKKWAPKKCCVTCTTNLRKWLYGKLKSLPFAVPMIWREQQNHVNDCYFCMTNVSGFTKKTKSNVIYPNVPSAIRPVPHCETLPIPVPPNSFEEIDSSSSDDSKASTSSNSIYEASTITNVPRLF